MPKIYIRELKITPDVDKSEVEFRVDVVGNADSVFVGPRESLRLRTKSWAAGKPGKPFRIKIEDPKLWSPDNPYLYEVDVAVAGRLVTKPLG